MTPAAGSQKIDSKNLLILALLAASAIALAPQCLKNALTSTTRDQRILETYGDQTIMGYGYIRERLKGIPKPQFFPETRYPYYGMNAHVVFPNFPNVIDPRMLVGINLRPDDIRTTVVAEAAPFSRQTTAGSHFSAWSFMTKWDYDLLNGLAVEFESAPKNAPQIQATLLHSPSDRRVEGQWRWEGMEISENILLPLNPSIKNVHTRGSLPFVLFLEIKSKDGSAPPPVKTVRVMGVKVNLSGYTLIHQKGYCFMALKNDFLREEFARPESPWRIYIMKHVNIQKIRDELQGRTS